MFYAIFSGPDKFDADCVIPMHAGTLIGTCRRFDWHVIHTKNVLNLAQQNSHPEEHQFQSSSKIIFITYGINH